MMTAPYTALIQTSQGDLLAVIRCEYMIDDLTRNTVELTVNLAEKADISLATCKRIATDFISRLPGIDPYLARYNPSVRTIYVNYPVPARPVPVSVNS